MTPAGSPDRPPRVDVHVHVNFRGHDTEKVVDFLDRLSIDRCWLLSLEDKEPCDENYHSLPVKEAITARDSYPGRFIPFASVDPRRPDALALFRQWLDLGCRGLGEQRHQVTIDDPRQVQLFRAAGEAKVPVLFHMDVPLPGIPYWYNADMKRLASVLALCPKTNFVGHGPGFWRGVADESLNTPDPYPKGPVTKEGPLPDLLRRFPNLYADVSAGSGVNGLTRDRIWARTFVGRFWDRILYGTDTFTEQQKNMIAEWALPAERLRAVMGGTAMRLLPDGEPEEGRKK